jgi:hypothetical protein
MRLATAGIAIACAAASCARLAAAAPIARTPITRLVEADGTPLARLAEADRGEDANNVRRRAQASCPCLNGGVCGPPPGGGHRRRAQAQHSCVCAGGFSGPLCETAGGGSGCDPGSEPGPGGACTACTGTLVSEDGAACHACPEGGLGFGHTECVFLGPRPGPPPPPPPAPTRPPPPPARPPPPPGSALAQFEAPLQGSLNTHNIIVKGHAYSARPDEEACAQNCLAHGDDCLSFDYGTANERCYLGTARLGDDATASLTESPAYQYFERATTEPAAAPAPPPAAGVPGDCDIYTDPCCAVPCMHGGICSACSSHNCLVQRLTFLCQCPRGFGGSTCETNQDDCGSAPCQNGGTCLDATNSYQCSCNAGFVGNECEQQGTQEIAPAPPPVDNGPTAAAGPAPPSCINEYDVGDNSCSSLLAAGYSCAAFFCTDENECSYSGMCDRTCDLCGAPAKVPATSSRGGATLGRGGTSTSSRGTGGRGAATGGRGAAVTCDNLYDTSAGAGTCDTMISEGYSCATDFCGTCSYAGYCDNSCNTCPAAAPPPPPTVLMPSTNGNNQVTTCTSMLAYSPMNPHASVVGMNYIRDCHGECIDASWFSDGRCDDGLEVRSPALLPCLATTRIDNMLLPPAFRGGSGYSFVGV